MTEPTEEFFQRGGVHRALTGIATVALYWEPYFDVVNNHQVPAKAYTVDVVVNGAVTNRRRFDDLFEAMTFFTTKERDLTIEAMAAALTNQQER